MAANYFCFCVGIAESHLAHEPLNSIDNQPSPSDQRDPNHAKVEGFEQAVAHYFDPADFLA